MIIASRSWPALFHHDERLNVCADSLVMANSGAPPKPWERVGGSSGPSPFRSPSIGNSTNNVGESCGDTKPEEKNDNIQSHLSSHNGGIVARPVPQRPWERNSGGYGTMTNYNAGNGSGMYGYNSPYGGNLGGTYAGGLSGNSMYRAGYGGLNGGYGSNAIGGMSNNGYGGPLGGYGMGQVGSYGYGSQDPNNSSGGSPPSPPSFWQSMLHVMHGVVTFFGRVSILVDENTQAFHFFITALLQLFDRSGVLYGELACFVLRLLRFLRRPRIRPQGGSEALPGQGTSARNVVENPKQLAGPWDNIWQDKGGRPQ